MDAKTVIDIVTMATSILPGSAGLHRLLVEYHSQIENLAPIIENIGEAGSALAAAEKAAPDLAKAIKDYVGSSADPARVNLVTENMTRVLLGLGPMDTEEERDWMNASTARTGDSSFGG